MIWLNAMLTENGHVYKEVLQTRQMIMQCEVMSSNFIFDIKANNMAKALLLLNRAFSRSFYRWLFRNLMF
jgi:hypothetical protein